MKKSLLFFISLVLIWSCDEVSSDSNPADSADINVTNKLVEFVTLDRAYIPPLFFTSIENLEASQASFKELKKEWNTFQNLSAEIFNDPEWESKQKRIHQHISAADSIISVGKQLKEAHEELEHMREILLEVRQANNIDYFVDHLTEFHEPMEQIVLTAKLTPIDQWTDETTSKIRAVIPEAESLWEQVRNAQFIPDQYGFNEQRFQKMKQYLEAETNALATLKLCLENEVTIEELRQNALGIKPNFAGLFKLFGNLEAYQQVPGEEGKESKAI